MAQLTPRDDKKKLVSEILKRVDQLLKANNLQHARSEIEKAKDLDPSNVYVRAYEERIGQLLEQQRLEKEQEREKEADIRHREIEEARKLAETERTKRLKRSREETRIENPLSEGLRIHEALQKTKEETYRRKSESPPERSLRPERPEEKTPAKTPIEEKVVENESIQMYRRILRNFWEDGVLDNNEREQLKMLRASFSLPEGTHEKLDLEVRRELYKEALRVAIKEKKYMPDSIQVEDLRRQFNISPEDQQSFIAELHDDIPVRSLKSQILLIDDDEKVLQFIAETLESAGYEVQAKTTSDEAYGLLKTGFVPDLILSDINLETSTMGGFTFYQKVREIEAITEVPFVFLSGLTDDVLIRTGKELGVDDYITKPFTYESLVSIIKGKLKRFEQIRKKKK